MYHFFMYRDFYLLNDFCITVFPNKVYIIWELYYALQFYFALLLKQTITLQVLKGEDIFVREVVH